MRGATARSCNGGAWQIFQSTLLMRGATRCILARSSRQLTNFNPRSSCEERPKGANLYFDTKNISIHAPHARSDPAAQRAQQRRWDFNPRSSCEERHFKVTLAPSLTDISIHAPHARSDSRTGSSRPIFLHFNPRSSCEERHGLYVISVRHELDFNPRSSCEERRKLLDSVGTATEFQSTLLMRGATKARAYWIRCCSISIHAPHARSDLKSAA